MWENKSLCLTYSIWSVEIIRLHCLSVPPQVEVDLLIDFCPYVKTELKTTKQNIPGALMKDKFQKETCQEAIVSLESPTKQFLSVCAWLLSFCNFVTSNQCQNIRNEKCTGSHNVYYSLKCIQKHGLLTIWFLLLGNNELPFNIFFFCVLG